jgi:hypothetical protein
VVGLCDVSSSTKRTQANNTFLFNRNSREAGQRFVLLREERSECEWSETTTGVDWLLEAANLNISEENSRERRRIL